MYQWYDEDIQTNRKIQESIWEIGFADGDGVSEEGADLCEQKIVYCNKYAGTGILHASSRLQIWLKANSGWGTRYFACAKSAIGSEF